MKNILIFSFCVSLLISCDYRSNSLSQTPLDRQPKPTQNEALQKRITALQHTVDRLNQMEAKMQELFDTVKREQKIPQSDWWEIDKNEISESWLDVKDRFETFRQVVKDYYGLLQEELEQPSEILSARQVKRIEAISKISNLWTTYLALLNTVIDDLGKDYFGAHEEYELEGIIKVWKELYKTWEDFLKELEDYQI